MNLPSTNQSDVSTLEFEVTVDEAIEPASASPPPAPHETAESGPTTETSDPTTEAADPTAGAEGESPEQDDEADNETLPAWLTTTRPQDRDPPWLQPRAWVRSRVPVGVSASQYKGRKKDPP